MKSLIGKGFFESNGDYYCYGEIKEATNKFILVEFLPNKGPNVSQFYRFKDICNENYRIFENVEKAKEFVDWLETPLEEQKPSLVEFKKERKH